VWGPAEHDCFWGKVKEESGVVPGWPSQVLDGEQGLLCARLLVLKQGVRGEGESVLVASVVNFALIRDRVVGCNCRIRSRRGEMGRYCPRPRACTDCPAYFQDAAPADGLLLCVHVTQHIVVDELTGFLELLVSPS